MQVILIERVAKLGQIGDVVRVRSGYARNFLLPQGKALRATKENKEKFETMKTELVAKNAEKKTGAEGLAHKLNGQSFVFHGYLPTDAGPRRARLRELEAASRKLDQTQVFIETPYRNAAMLEAAIDALAPTTRLAIACGLTLAEGWASTRTAAEWKAARVALPDRVPAVFSLLA